MAPTPTTTERRTMTDKNIVEQAIDKALLDATEKDLTAEQIDLLEKKVKVIRRLASPEK